MQKYAKRTLSLLLALCMVFSLFAGAPLVSAAAAPASNNTDATTLYLKPNSNWLMDGARFAVFYWNDGGNYWADMTAADDEGTYQAAIPAGYSNIIFCRMNPNAAENNWDNKWNQTSDLTVPTDGTNCYAVADGTWDQGGGTWSVYPAEDEEPDPETPTATYIIAGNSTTLFGTEWAPSNTANQMTYNSTSGLYEKVYTNVAAGSYEFKVTDGTWNNSWGDNGNNYGFTVESTSNVTISFNADTKAITVELIVLPDYYLIGYINGANYGCEEDYENLGDYKFVDGKVTATFTETSYVFVKTGDNANWYMTDGWLGEVTEATLYNTATSAIDANKLMVPANVEITFTLITNSDGTLTLGYTTAGSDDPTPTVDYYLVGYINSADNYGTDYKFVDCKLNATFTADTYVCVQDSNGNTYMTDGWLGSVTEATLSLASNLANPDKLQVPTNTDLTFTLTENGDGTLTLSYETVTDTPDIPEGYTKVTIHFLKPDNYGSAINAYVWTAGGALPGYEAYNSWPGKAISANADHEGWYDLVVGTEEPISFNFIFNDGSSQTDDLTTGTITGDTELWVVNNTVLTEAPGVWLGDCTVNLHFQKPADWADTISAYAWSGSTLFLGGWPGSTAAVDTLNIGWYTISLTVTAEYKDGINFIFNDNNGNQTADLATGTLSTTTDIWVSDGSIVARPDGWVDASRTIHVPGTFPGPSWDPTSNQMTYDSELGLYVITFENVAAGTYEYKIAINGAWAENYGANGIAGGDNIMVVVPTAQDVTIWYNDETHYSACSVYYDLNADVTLSGTGIPDGTRMTDPGLTGLFSVTVSLPAGTYSDLQVTYGDTVISIAEFTTLSDKDVHFYFDPSTGLAYHDGSDKKVETSNIYYTTKDLDYKDPFGAVATGESVTFTIETGTDATAVNLIVKGYPSVGMTKDGTAVDGVQRWTCTTSFASIGEYQYYFAITNGSDMVFYCDDNYNDYYGKGDYGTGTVRDLSNIFPYDLVVYEAGFETPDWMKNAVIYQIFPDRFYNADTTNDQAQTSARGEVNYEFVDWGILPENPSLITDPDYPSDAFMGDGEWSNEIYGGDLDGITEKIGYLKELGVTVIYLNPIFASISNHRYDACDYMEIDPILGDLGDFEELVAAAEANGMHIILDGVFNHVSDDSVYFDRYYKFLGKSDKIGAYPYWAYVYDYMAENSVDQETAEAAAKAYFSENYGISDWSYTEWFKVYNTTMVGSVDNIGQRAGKEVYSYDGWWGYDSMPIIYSTNGSEYQTGNWAEEIICNENGTSVTQYWISKGNNGWRLDVANEVSDETWQNFRDSVKALDSEAVIIGEIWADATHYLMGDMYDSVMNYVFRDAVAGFARGYQINRDNKAVNWDDDYTADDAMATLEILRERYPEEAFYAMMNLVGSHDTARILSYLDDVEDDRYQTDVANSFPRYSTTSDRAKQLQYVVSFLQFTYAGAPTIYYGDEIGMVGADDPDDRRTFEWDVLDGNSSDDLARQELLAWYSNLAAIRADYPALRTGSVEPFSTGNDDVMGFVRSDNADTLIVLANRADSEQTYELEGRWTDLVSGETFTDTITIPAYRGVILVAAKKDSKPSYSGGGSSGSTCYCANYTDIDTGAWYHEAVCYALEHGIMKGTGDGTTFSPYMNLTRGMMMTMLARLSGVNTEGGNPWYEKGMEWAVTNGVSDGTQPETEITREQVVTMLYRFAGSPAVSGDWLAAFPDGDNVSPWAKDAINWAVSKGIIKGKGDGSLDPQATATRAEVAQMMANYLKSK